jgi:hypothetical protein
MIVECFEGKSRNFGLLMNFTGFHFKHIELPILGFLL